jgi:NhaA family Na+:H+ antiporter
MAQASHRPPASALRNLLTHEAAGGLVLIASAAIALAIANTALAPAYFGALATKVAGLSVLHWINDALMALFFVLVGLEIKRELLDGQLATWPHRVLPSAGAIGGMLVPALVYVVCNLSSPKTLQG